MKVRIPLVDLKAQFCAIEPEVRAAIDRVLASQKFILGEEVERFEARIAAYLGVRHAVGVASGSDALVLSLLALGIGPGDAVLTSPMSYIATAEAITRVGARPIFADVGEDFNLSISAFEAVARRARELHLRAVIPVHLFGRTCEIEAIVEVARAHGLAVVEDACQAIGAAKGGRKAGSFSDLGCFSFFPSKNLGGYGDGGLVVTDRDDLAERVRELRVHGSRSKYRHERLGMNSRLDAIQAAVLGAKLSHLDSWNQARRERARAYNRDLEGSAVHAPPFDGDGRFDIFHLYVVRVPRREAVIRNLSMRGIQTAVHYPIPLHLQPCFEGLGGRRGDCPVAERLADEVVSLPLYPDLPEEARAEVAREVRRLAAEAE
jgi:dTDP-4-amino-4,6-dideoxygalactose transaminase